MSPKKWRISIDKKYGIFLFLRVYSFLNFLESMPLTSSLSEYVTMFIEFRKKWLVWCGFYRSLPLFLFSLLTESFLAVVVVVGWVLLLLHKSLEQHIVLPLSLSQTWVQKFLTHIPLYMYKVQTDKVTPSLYESTNRIRNWKFTKREYLHFLKHTQVQILL